MNSRAILHSDLNSFYASVEMMLDPRLKSPFDDLEDDGELPF